MFRNQTVAKVRHTSLPALIMFLCVIGCVSSNKQENGSLRAPKSQRGPTSSSDANSSPFALNVVCSLPKKAFRNTPFARLGGGSWGKWNDSGGELDYACNGGTDSIKLKKTDESDITAEYGVIGGANQVRYVSAEYTAFQYLGQTRDERVLRREYVDFCDKLAELLYGQKLSKGFRERMLNESRYSPSGTANEYAEKIGSGYLTLSSNRNKSLMFQIHLQFFPSEAIYRRFKNA